MRHRATAIEIDPAAIVAEARDWLGTPYRHQASLKGVGCDCLGLIRGVWRGVLGPEPEAAPPYAASWAESAPAGTDPLAEAAGRHLVPLALARDGPEPGAVLLFAFRRHLPARHCAVATGAGTMIHAHDGARVAEVALTPWWRRHLAHAFRFPGAASPGAAGTQPDETVSLTPRTSMTLRTVS
ncbi:NlpC/P60 family protein [Methylobacterium planeticum]|uniref:Peptidase P60 n=1 Tax=Methylobacterium planeticum TaxID=2615211 RepID=A0A6N6MN63_9HYPH|nr:NlpC/P60 family protein [Methylobacterium planeticum]KAB1072831.1 peptidase P60 [Methylobacterium planeticum]